MAAFVMSIIGLNAVEVFNEAHRCVEDGQYIKAIDLLKSWLVVNGSDGKAFALWHMIGYIHTIQGKLEEALVFFQKAIAINDRFIQSRYALADTFVKLGRYTDAKEQIAWLLNPIYAVDLLYNEAFEAACMLSKQVQQLTEQKQHNGEQLIKLYQIYYRDEQLEHLDTNFLAWDNRANERPEWCEYWVMREAAKSFETNFGDLTGFFSWKYQEKININHQQIMAFIAANPGKDCYIFSPGVFQVAFFLNVWQQGETHHPGITDKAQKILDSLNIKVKLTTTVDHHLTTAYANYWVASKSFWQGYLLFMDSVFSYLESALNDDEDGFWELAHGSKGGSDGHVQFLPVIPYIVERMFSIYMKLNPQFKVVAWQYSLDDMRNRVHGAAGLVPIANWLKFMYTSTKEKKYILMFSEIQQEMVSAVQHELDQGIRIR